MIPVQYALGNGLLLLNENPSFLAEQVRVNIWYLVYKLLKNLRVQFGKSCGSFLRVFTVLCNLSVDSF